MFDKLEDLLVRLEEILSELNEPGVANDPARFQKLMKEQSELQPIVDAYKEYKACQQTVEESLMMLDEESDEEMREMLKEELADAKSRIEELEGLMPEVREHEPILALDGMEDGLYFYRKIVAQAGEYLEQGGWLCFEIGYDQGEALKEMMTEAGYGQVKIIKDLAGLDRVAIGQKNNNWNAF